MSSSLYLYGFNTQEKVDEVKGTGNHYSAQFWEYDPRVVHRWNIDPRPNPSMSPYAILGGNPIWNTDWAGDTTRIYNEVGEYQFSIMDNLPNEDHFLNKGLLPLAESLQDYSGDPNEIGKILRSNSDFFIGATTRDRLKALQESYSTEAAFVLYPTESRELDYIDITHLSDPPPTTNSIHIQPGAIRANFSTEEYSSLVGFGHTHLGSSTPSPYEVFRSRPHGDYYPILHQSWNFKPRQVLLVAGQNDFTIYTSREGIWERNSFRFMYINPSNPSTTINYNGNQ
jgi:hypothetical protein